MRLFRFDSLLLVNSKQWDDSVGQVPVDQQFLKSLLNFRRCLGHVHLPTCIQLLSCDWLIGLR